MRWSVLTLNVRCHLGSQLNPPQPSVEVNKVLVGCRQSMQVLDHDSSKLPLIPDEILCQDIPPMIKDDALNEESEVTEGNIDTSWYRGQVYYGIKFMVVEGSTAC